MSLSLLSFIPRFDSAPKIPSRQCALHACRNKQNWRSLSGEHRGIHLGERWYCSVECFVQAVRAPLFALSTQRVAEIARTPRLSVGLALLSKGLLTADQLRIATAESQLRGESFEATVIRLHFVTDRQVAAARSAQWGYPVLAHEQIGRTVRAELPRAIFDISSAAPIHYSQGGRRILLGFVYRVEHSLLESIEKVTGCRAEACFITPADRDSQMEHLTTPQDYEEIILGDPVEPEVITHTLGRMSHEIAARDACITRCQNHIWARLTGTLGIRDLIFPVKREVGENMPKTAGIFEESLASLA
jgi:Type II secretion system (T2SS), protein E, N-terminal domain